MSNEPAIGIDLGTTFSCVSVYRNGRAELIPNAEGDRLTPSIVYFSPATGEVSVGQTADELLPQFPKNGLMDAKRFIGRKYDDEFISKYINSNQVPFSLVQGDDGQAAFEIEVSNSKIIKKPEDVSAEVLKYLKSTACDYLGESVTKAVISVPANFSNAQRTATKRAAESAGLTVLKLITEPTAGAIHYVSDKKRRDSNILVFDFGGGTLDVSLIKVTNNIFRVKAVNGDTLLGGRNFDEMLFKYFYEEIQERNNNKTFATKKFNRRLSNMCVNLKKKLSTNKEFPLVIDRYDGNSDLNLPMTREKFEKITKDIFPRIMDVVESCLHDSGIAKADISEVVLVGGSTRIPKVRELLSSYFGSDKIKTDLNPDEAVAAGASIQAAFLLGGNQHLEKFNVTEVTPLSLGIKSERNLMVALIPRNSPLPADASHIFATGLNDQEGITFSIYEGERKNTDYNNKLGDCSITGLPKKRAGDVKFSVNMRLDEDGILNLTAVENSTGKNNKLVVKVDQFRLTDRKIKFSLEEAKRHKAEDDAFENFVRFRIKVQRHCRHILYNIKTYCSDNDQDAVKECCEKFLMDSDKVDFTEIGKLEKLFAKYEKSVSKYEHDVLKKKLILELRQKFHIQ